ncbi:hypothetical protein GQ44DRAFT_711857 [Phaeosphaeriaceae sp. PMI808]|nr:hypothetical protein GQ44DRAFT_711857 [Phaeosphaeriaceae sp. PMI808]
MAPPRPRWEAHKKQAPPKTQKSQKPKTTNDSPATTSIPPDLQQLLLNIFRHSFSERFAEDIRPILQDVKGHLYNRDFATAFGKTEYLEAYAARWSASRALGYADLFWDLRTHFWPEHSRGEESKDEVGISEGVKKRDIVCLGGGAGAEVVALAGLQWLVSQSNHDGSVPPMTKTNVVTIDIADWTTIVEQLAKQITNAPPLSKYASAAVQAANIALLEPDTFHVSFHQQDILNADLKTLATLVKDATLVTLMFTLNELYSTSLSLTQKFLLNLTSEIPTGSMLLVVDSPGSYSTVTLNGAEKKYPMQWLLDHTLLNQSGEDGKTREQRSKEDAKWEKIHEDESRWFRLAPALQYPIEVENMRMQIHLYRRL